MTKTKTTYQRDDNFGRNVGRHLLQQTSEFLSADLSAGIRVKERKHFGPKFGFKLYALYRK